MNQNSFMANLNLEIISPKGILFQGECFMTTVPSVEGEMGVMFGHESVIAALKAGVITIYDDKQAIVKTIEINGGFAEVQNNKKLLVLVD
jgi:F-type H+-transporting ATPase subunit epsilon